MTASLEYAELSDEMNLKASHDSFQSIAEFPMISRSNKPVFQRLYVPVHLYSLNIICIDPDGTCYGTAI